MSQELKTVLSLITMTQDSSDCLVTNLQYMYDTLGGMLSLGANH